LNYFIPRIFPESIRWLVSMQRYDEAAKIIEKMARWNNVKLDFDIKEALSMSKSAEEKSKEPQLVGSSFNVIQPA
jgi:hypothetical protein